MPVLGVVTCEILELEWAHILSSDPDVARITVLNNDFSQGFIEAMCSAGRNRLEQIPAMGDFAPRNSDQLEILVRVLELGLHNRKRILQEGLVQAVKEMAGYVDAIVLGYGLCGNALEKPEELLADAGVPLFLPMDEDHPVDDCVGLLIGGRDCYYEEQCRVAGTFFMTSGFARHWKRMFQLQFRDSNIKFAKRIFEAYERSLIIATPVLPTDQIREDIEEFNQMFGFRTEVREGTLEILATTWEGAKKALCSLS